MSLSLVEANGDMRMPPQVHAPSHQRQHQMVLASDVAAEQRQLAQYKEFTPRDLDRSDLRLKRDLKGGKPKAPNLTKEKEPWGVQINEAIKTQMFVDRARVVGNLNRQHADIARYLAKHAKGDTKVTGSTETQPASTAAS